MLKPSSVIRRSQPTHVASGKQLAAASTPNAPSLTDEALRALHALGVTRATRFEDAARDVVRAWDRQLHEGLRTGGAA